MEPLWGVQWCELVGLRISTGKEGVHPFGGHIPLQLVDGAFVGNLGFTLNVVSALKPLKLSAQQPWLIKSSVQQLADVFERWVDQRTKEPARRSVICRHSHASRLTFGVSSGIQLPILSWRSFDPPHVVAVLLVAVYMEVGGCPDRWSVSLT